MAAAASPSPELPLQFVKQAQPDIFILKTGHIHSKKERMHPAMKCHAVTYRGVALK
jgi:hypothetical protein